MQHPGSVPIPMQETEETRYSPHPAGPEDDRGAPEKPPEAHPDTPAPGLLARLLRRVPRLLPEGELAAIAGLLRRRTITVDLEDGLLRVVALRGQRVLAWGTSVVMEAPPQDGDTGPGPEGAAAQLRTLLEAMHTRHGRLVTSLPAYTPLIRQLRLPRIGHRYLSQVILSEVLESIPFSEGEVDITWQHQKTATGGQVVAVAVPREAMDRHVQMLKEARVRPAVAYPKAASLAAAAGASSAIVVDLGQVSTAIVLVREGVPRVVHQVEHSGTGVGPQERAESVARAVEQVVGYYKATSGNTEETRVPAVFTGPLATNAPLSEALEKTLEREVLPLATPLAYPDHFPAHDYAANLGLAMLDRARPRFRDRLSRRKSTSADLLPDRHRSRSLLALPTLVFAALLSFLYLAMVVTPRVQDTVASQEALSSRVATLEQQTRSLSLIQGQGAAIRRETQSTAQSASEMEASLEGLAQDMKGLLAQMEAIIHGALPPGVQLSTLQLQKSEFVLGGAGPSHLDVILYSENLRASGLFDDVQVVRVDMSGSAGAPGSGREGQAAGAVTFQIKAYLPATALDGGSPLPQAR